MVLGKIHGGKEGKFDEVGFGKKLRLINYGRKMFQILHKYLISFFFFKVLIVFWREGEGCVVLAERRVDF